MIAQARAKASSSHCTPMGFFAVGLASAAEAAMAASDRPATATAGLLAGRNRAGRGANRGRPTLGAPAAANSGWVTVAANARFRAAAQSRHSFAPGGHSLAQMRHFIQPFSSGMETGSALLADLAASGWRQSVVAAQFRPSGQ
jgi:hypothetical protein